jgi:hypothetical protein
MKPGFEAGLYSCTAYHDIFVSAHHGAARAKVSLLARF